jgi:predicted dehydrogenase/threonine dehydrogenase-like Zn-dependent dehydrogenase
MKQILQHLRSGRIEVADIPAPGALAGHLLIRTRASLVSSGSERTIVEFARASLLAKARSEPERVRQVLDKIRTDGLMPTLEAVFSRLDEPMPLGYCNAGVVLDTGSGVEGMRPGDRVVSNGPHAEIVCVPKNLCAAIPDGVDDEAAAFTVLGAVALQGVRLLAPTLGESVAVVGLGLVGLIAVQLLRASGCRVLGIDPDPDRRALALSFGAEAVAGGSDARATGHAALTLSRGRGMDAVLIAASAKGNEIVQLAASMCRKRGRVVLTGVVGLELDRRVFYEKELTFQVSCSYGPGRYDPRYEEDGEDYPVPYVRWTAQRNFEAFLDALRDRRVSVAPLVGRRAAIADAPSVYADLSSSARSGAPGIVLTYPWDGDATVVVVALKSALAAAAQGTVRAGVIGAGQFARGVLLPALRASGVDLVSIASQSGVAARHLGRKFGFQEITTDVPAMLAQPSINTVFILTRHDSHASLVAAALRAGKHVFVEKPLALTPDQLEEVLAAYRGAGDRHLLVGFNRGFAPLVLRMLEALRSRSGPASIVATINAGALPPAHWLHDPRVGGGRILGEACHWIDLMLQLVGAPAVSVDAHATGTRTDKGADPGTSLFLTFADGSLGVLHYLTSGHRSFPKERIEVFFDGRVLSLQNFLRLEGHGIPGLRRVRLWRQDKGHRAEVAQFVDRIRRGGEPLIPIERLDQVTRIGFAAVESVRTGRSISLRTPGA